MRAVLSRLGRLLAASLLCLTASAAGAAPRAFIVGAYILPPLSYLDEAGELRGESVDLVRRALAALDYEPEFRVLPMKRCLVGMADGDISMMLPVVVTPERSTYMRFSDPVLSLRSVLWKRGAGPSGCWETFADLAGKRIGTTLGYYYGPDWQQALAEGLFTVAEVSGRSPDRTLFLLLVEGRLDMLLCDLTIGRRLKERNSPLFDDVFPCPKLVGRAIPLSVPISQAYFKRHGMDGESFMDDFNAALKTAGSR